MKSLLNVADADLFGYPPALKTDGGPFSSTQCSHNFPPAAP